MQSLVTSGQTFLLSHTALFLARHVSEMGQNKTQNWAPRNHSLDEAEVLCA